MFTNTLRIVAATIAVLLLTTAVEAKRYRQTSETITCNERGCSDYGKRYASVDATTQTARAKRSQRRYTAPPARAMRIDTEQEYAVVGPNGQIEKREVYESKSGVVRSKKTGATARVSPKYARAFQGFIDDLEAGGASLRFLGGYRAGKCWQGSKHPCGMALDYCQYARGVVDKRCNLPGRAVVAQIAARHGLFEGGQWCNNDYGHVEAGGSTACGKSWNPYADAKKVLLPTYADDRDLGNGSIDAVMDDGSRRGEYRSMKERRKALALQSQAEVMR